LLVGTGVYCLFFYLPGGSIQMFGTIFLYLLRVIAFVVLSLGFCAHAASFPANNAGQAMLLLTENDNGRTVAVKTGESLQISLPDNVTTGYQWTIVAYNKNIVKELGSNSFYPSSAIGAGGKIVFVFQGLKPGKGEINLKQWRQWEGDASIIKRFGIKLKVYR
jgi:inhibitor of cysteine peptidase